MKNYNDFINEVDNTSFDQDHVSGIQCIDLIKRYLKECFNINIPNGYGNAVDYYKHFNNKKLLKDNFELIQNTPSFVPKKGDIMVWNENRGKGAGHVAICTGEGDTHYFYSYDLNWNGSKKVRKVKHDYKNVLGVLRYKKKEENNEDIKEGGQIKIEVKFTGARNNNNVLVELDHKQFWILSKYFNEEKSYIVGTVCFVQEKSVGVALYYNYNSIREFQMIVPKKYII